jgi:hypothetical protein
LGLQVLAGLFGTSHFVVVATVEVSTETALGSAVPGSKSDSRVVFSVTNEQAQRLGQDENVVIIVLEDLEDLGICVRAPDLVGKGDSMTINGGGV